MKKGSILLLFIYWSISLYAQYSVQGIVKDSLTGERIAGASIYFPQYRIGSVSNSFGYYHLELPSGADTVELRVSFVGYLSQSVNLTTNKSYWLDIMLNAGLTLQEVKILSSGAPKSTSISMLELPVKSIKTLPKLMGEPDIMRVFQLMPGVQAGNEGTSGLNVRGGSPDQNLILLDDVPLYYVNHVGGFVSVFNPDALNSATLHKGGFSARYGGRISSVMDVRMKDGNLYKKGGNATLGILSTKLSWEAPLIKEKSSVMLSLRRSMFDLFTRAYMLMHQGGDKTTAGYYILDFNAKLNYKISNNNHLYLSLYSGRDKMFVNLYDSPDYNYQFTIHGKRHTQWGNQMAALRWNHIFHNKLFSNTTIGITHFYYDIYTGIERKPVADPSQNIKAAMGFNSKIYDVFLKSDLDFFKSEARHIKFGAAFSWRHFRPSTNYSGVSIQNKTWDEAVLKSPFYTGYEAVGYAEEERRISDKLQAVYGMRLIGLFIDNKSYFYGEPRLLLSWSPQSNYSLKTSYSYMTQPVHLLSNSGVGLPVDIWVPANSMAPPETAHQAVVASSFNIPGLNWLDFTIEGYYKSMNNLIDYKDGISFYGGQGNWEEKIETGGTGKAYGIEFLIEKKEGKNTGWISYTLSESKRRFDRINHGQAYHYVYSRPHDFSMVYSRKINPIITITAVWVYNSGNNITLPHKKNIVLSQQSGFNPVNYLEPEFVYSESHIYPGKNNFRMPAYHRLDLSISFERERLGRKRVFCIDVYNAYCRLNPYYLYFKAKPNGDVSLWGFSPFPIIPSISYSFSF